MIPSATPPSRTRRPAIGLTGVVVLIALVSSACSSGGQRPAAVVNGDEISQTQLQQSIPLFRFLGTLGQSQCGQPVGSETQAQACTRFTLSNLIQEQVVRQYATAHHVSVDPTSVNTTLSDLEKQVGADQLSTLLKNAHVTRDQLHAFAARLLLFREVEKAVGQEQTSQTQLRQSYEQNIQQYTQLHVEHILVKSRQQAAKLAAEATPKSFQQLADRYSTDPSVSSNHGDLGLQPASSLDPAFVSAALALQPGQISRPVQTQFGWHVIYLVAKPVQTPFDQVRDQILQQLSQSVFSSWLLRQLGDGTIQVNPLYGRLDPKTASVVPVTSTATGSLASPTPTESSVPPVNQTSPTSSP